MSGYTDDDYALVAERGAFLKIGVAAGCLLARRDDRLEALKAALDDLMVGVVMLDDQFDWAGDLAAGRFNVFVAYAARQRQTPDRAADNLRAVIYDICSGQGVRPYFDALHRRVARAAERAGAAHCDGLCRFITWFDDEARMCGEWLEARARGGIREAV
jgi:hypothetical protein